VFEEVALEASDVTPLDSALRRVGAIKAVEESRSGNALDISTANKEWREASDVEIFAKSPSFTKLAMPVFVVAGEQLARRTAARARVTSFVFMVFSPLSPLMRTIFEIYWKVFEICIAVSSSV
jgi:hypothetical protein